MNTYHFIFESYTIHIKAATLAQAYEILSRECVMKEEKLMQVECKRNSKQIQDMIHAYAAPAKPL